MPFATTLTRSRLARAACALAAFAALPGGERALAQSSGWVQRPEAYWRRPIDSAAGLPREIELRASGDGLDRIESGRESLQDARLHTQPITDLMVRLRPIARNVRPSPGREPPVEAERSYVEVQVLAVTGGRISPTAVAQCRQFEGEVLVCSVECDGGAFGLRRGREPGEHFLVLGVPDNSGGSPTGRPGFRLGSCETKGGAAPLLLPRGGRLATELRLLESR